jgi:hypothetical protein
VASRSVTSKCRFSDGSATARALKNYIVESTAVGVILSARRGIIVGVNRAAPTRKVFLYKTPRQETVRRELDKLGRDAQAAVAAHRQLPREDEQVDGRIRALRTTLGSMEYRCSSSCGAPSTTRRGSFLQQRSRWPRNG